MSSKTRTADQLEIIQNLNRTFWLGISAGFIAVIGYAVNLSNANWKLLFLLILLACASFMSGFFLGFLFGIPKRNAEKESSYNLSNNLIDISDWLTKIIVGLGLVEIRRIPEFFVAVGSYIQTEVNGESSIKVFSICCIIYFTIFGLYYGYNYMRLFLSGQFKEADDNLLAENERKLSETAEVLNQKNLSPDNVTVLKGTNAIAVYGPDLDNSSKKKLDEYDQLLKSVKKEDDYSARDWYYKGVAEYDRKEFNKCIAYMKNALEKDSSFEDAASAYIYIALAYYEMGLYDKAIEFNNEMITKYKTSPLLSLAYYNNGIYYDEQGKNDEALAEYEKAIAIKPNDVNSWVNKSYTLLKSGRYDEVIIAADRATGINTNAADAWYNKACALAYKNDKPNMMINLEKAVAINPALKINATTDPAFTSFKEDEDFKKIIG